MTSTITGFRKTLEANLPNQVHDLRAKCVRLEEELRICRDDEAYLIAIARVAGVVVDGEYPRPAEMGVVDDA
jgi:hypothetical protein